MDRGFYTSVSAMMSGSKKMADISNNVANINTIGFKKDTSMIQVFDKLVINKLNDKKNIGELNNQVYIEDTYTDFTDGSLYQTGLATEYAIVGDGFFKVEVDGEYQYTRDGSFKKDAEGFLVTSGGHYVMDRNNQRIQVDGDANLADQLMIVSFEDNRTLGKTTNGFYSNMFGLSEETTNQNPVVKQGYLEMSNVNAAEELTDMIKFQRYYQFNQRSLSVRDELMEQLTQF